MALKTKLKEVEAERDSLRPALTFLAKDLKPVICNHDTTEKRNQKSREITEELVEVKKKKYTQASHSKENAAKDTNTILLSKLSNYLIQEIAQYNWFKVTRPSFFGGVPSYFEGLWYPPPLLLL